MWVSCGRSRVLGGVPGHARGPFVEPGPGRHGAGTQYVRDHSAELSWADVREDTMISPAPGFRPLCGPPGPPGAPGTAPARKIVQVAPTIRPGDQF